MSTTERVSDPYRCLFCGNTAQMRYAGSYSKVKKTFPEEGVELLEFFDLLECPVCHNPTLRSYHWMEPCGSAEDLVFTQLYPKKGNIPEGLPENIGKAYLAAEQVRPIDANAYGVLIGRLIELIAKDKGSRKKKLSTALLDMKEKGHIPESVYNLSKNLTALRNVGGHAWLGTLTDDEVPILSELAEAVLFHVYVIPCLVFRASNAVDEIRKSQAKAKRAG